MWFTLLIFIFPTVAVYYLFFTAMKLLLLGVQGMPLPTPGTLFPMQFVCPAAPNMKTPAPRAWIWQ